MVFNYFPLHSVVSSSGDETLSWKSLQLQDYLVRAKLRPFVQNPGGNRGTHKCASNRCDVCNYLAVGDSFSSHVTGTSYTVNHRLDCNSRNVVYLIALFTQ